MALIFEVSAALAAVALFVLTLMGFRSVRAELRALKTSLSTGMGVLAATVGEATVAHRRELAEVARSLPAEPPPAASLPRSAPAARPGPSKIAERLAAAQEAAHARSPQPAITAELSEDEHKTLEFPVPADMTMRPPTPAAELDEEPEELTRVAPPPKALPAAPVLKKPPPVLKNTGYRWVGPAQARAPRRSEPPIAVLRAPSGRALEEQDDGDARARVEALARGAGVRIADDEKTPPSGTLVEVGRLPVDRDDLEHRRAGAFPAFCPDDAAAFPKVEGPAQRIAGPGLR